MIVLRLLLVLIGLQFILSAPAGCHPCYVQVDTSGGMTAEPQIFQFDLDPGDLIGHTVMLHGVSGSVRVRMWTEQSGQDAAVDQSITITAPYSVYLPI